MGASRMRRPPACQFALALGYYVDSLQENYLRRTRFDGSVTRFDGSVTRFDGSVTRFDGSVTRFDGSVTRFDGSVTRPWGPAGF